MQRLFALVDSECAEATNDATVTLVAERLSKAAGEMKAATMWFMQNAMDNPNNLGAGAYPYMTLTGIVSLGLMWLRMAKVASTTIANGTDDKAFYEAKLACARHWATRNATEAGALRREIEAGSESVMALSAEQFAVA